jgi:hypothetical protein
MPRKKAAPAVEAPPRPVPQITLQAPSKPGGRGDETRWSLHIAYLGRGGGGTRQPVYALDGPPLLPTDAEPAKRAAARLLGYEPTWEFVPPVIPFPNWPLTYRATDPERMP